jgi:hypothetical protein
MNMITIPDKALPPQKRGKLFDFVQEIPPDPYSSAFNRQGSSVVRRKLMKAIVYTKYGPPAVFQLKEVQKLTPKEDEVLIKVHAASVNAMDYRFLRVHRTWRA